MMTKEVKILYNNLNKDDRTKRENYIGHRTKY